MLIKNNARTSSTAQPSDPARLFGSGSTSANPMTSNTGGMATAGGLFGSTQPKPSTGLFGSSTTTAPAPSQPGTTGGLFGVNVNNQAQQGGITSGGLFGSASNQQSTQQSAGGGLFGSNATAQPQQQQQQQAGGGLFGAPTTIPQTSTTGGLFGQTQPKPSGGLL